MAELMANPSVLKKAQLEIRHFMAGQARVHEAALSNNLGYLKAIIEETLRDLKYWENPDTFMPERFQVDHAFDYKGIDFEFTPFGTSRRICPGINFANANMEIALASLLYHFDWKLPVGVKPEKVDMTEVFGVTIN
ncbi:putative Cytochrome P450 71D11 [Panicum miliaceum]|uniref:Cytochrome P450 71D11 n=1 Tax=Panicum miliaceum TaxID=4540 RepID=A0A3L6S8J4_PANMI|nr:putative Cytochrome P450 71D11 [Panicum miliaceum]